jgi:hypothetical protein
MKTLLCIIGVFSLISILALSSKLGSQFDVSERKHTISIQSVHGNNSSVVVEIDKKIDFQINCQMVGSN